MEGTKRASCWSVTINNPGAKDEEEIHLARSKGWKVEGQLEKGAEGTPHYQLIVKTPQVRFSAVKKQFSRGHIEIARNPIALEQYTTKPETRIGQLPVGSESYPSVSKMYQLIVEYINERNYLDATGSTWWTKESGNKSEMDIFDEAVGVLIARGYFVEVHAMNPAVRGAWKRWHFEVIERTLRVQESQEVVVPMDITQDADTNLSPSSSSSSRDASS